MGSALGDESDTKGTAVAANIFLKCLSVFHRLVHVSQRGWECGSVVEVLSILILVCMNTSMCTHIRREKGMRKRKGGKRERREKKQKRNKKGEIP